MNLRRRVMEGWNPLRQHSQLKRSNCSSSMGSMWLRRNFTSKQHQTPHSTSWDFGLARRLEHTSTKWTSLLLMGSYSIRDSMVLWSTKHPYKTLWFSRGRQGLKKPHCWKATTWVQQQQESSRRSFLNIQQMVWCRSRIVRGISTSVLARWTWSMERIRLIRSSRLTIPIRTVIWLSKISSNST